MKIICTILSLHKDYFSIQVCMNIYLLFCDSIQYNKQFGEVLSFPTLHENINIWQHTSRRRLHLQLEEVKRKVFPVLPLHWSLWWIKGRRSWQGTGGRGRGAGLPCSHSDTAAGGQTAVAWEICHIMQCSFVWAWRVVLDVFTHTLVYKQVAVTVPFHFGVFGGQTWEHSHSSATNVPKQVCIFSALDVSV